VLPPAFFNRSALTVAQELLGKVLRVKNGTLWLSARIIETEAYFTREKGSHASLGYSEKRKALFMPPGTIYMYYARGGDSLNISCRGPGNAVLIKSAVPYLDDQSPSETIQRMQALNPHPNRSEPRPVGRLCSGQTLLCKSLGITVPEWDQKTFDPDRFYIEDVGYRPIRIIQTTRLGIPKGRDEHLMYRFIDYSLARFCTENPLTKRHWKAGQHYRILVRKSDRETQ
jgi:DNA-3-methyladenine glycosylase